MVNVGFGWSSIQGLILVVLGISIVPLGLTLRQQQKFDILIFFENIVLFFIYILSGAIIFFQGWRLDPILQFSQFLLIVATCYLSLKNILRRS